MLELVKVVFGRGIPFGFAPGSSPSFLFFGGGPSGREGIRVLEEKISNAVEIGREDRTLLRDWVTECSTRGLKASFAMTRLLFDRLHSIGIFFVEELEYR